MTIHAKSFDFWATQGELYIMPGGAGHYPEGWDPRPLLTMLSAGQDTVEFGSGIGRLAGFFDPALYHGIDINPKAVEIARRSCPDHKFSLLNYDEPLPDAAFYFAYTVFLHIDDEVLPQILSVIPKSCKRFCIAEMTGREWRLDTQQNPPVYGRAPKEYVELMAKAGFTFSNFLTFPYLHYYRKKLLETEKLYAHLGLPEGADINTNVDFLMFYRD